MGCSLPDIVPLRRDRKGRGGSVRAVPWPRMLRWGKRDDACTRPWRQVNFWLGALVEMRSDDLYRMKGVLAVKGFDRRFVCQARRREVHWGACPGWDATCRPRGDPRGPCPVWPGRSSLWMRPCLQGVHMLFEGLADRPWGPDEQRSSKMVFIGKDLDADLLREGFEACRAKDD